MVTISPTYWIQMFIPYLFLADFLFFRRLIVSLLVPLSLTTAFVRVAEFDIEVCVEAECVYIGFPA